jgi:2-phospho-L-lactate guanylyltransferase
MTVGALVPFKCFTRAKQRLRTAFRDHEVEALGRAMLRDVLETLGRVRGLRSVTVLTDDREVAEAARAAGAATRIETPDPGLNGAIEAGTRELLERGIEASLVVLGDLPLLETADVEAVLEAGADHAVVIVPSTDGGTAMLLRRPPDVIPACFGKQSAEAHALQARARGVAPLELVSIDETARVDLDTPEDLDRLLASARPCHTRDVLRTLRP